MAWEKKRVILGDDNEYDDISASLGGPSLNPALVDEMGEDDELTKAVNGEGILHISIYIHLLFHSFMSTCLILTLSIFISNFIYIPILPLPLIITEKNFQQNWTKIAEEEFPSSTEKFFQLFYSDESTFPARYRQRRGDEGISS